MNFSSPHTFHIPVMGLAYTIDTPVKVARFGINSAISIIEDNLVEMMRKYYYPQIREEYLPISVQEEDYRARRITDYLGLINKIVQEQVEKLRASAFEAGSDLAKYFEMLPDENLLKQKYHQLSFFKGQEKKELEDSLREGINPGAIEVNIMTKLDKNNYAKDGSLVEDGSDAICALKGYAKSTLTNSAIVFSAGLNPRLFNYMEKLDEFDAKGFGDFDKKVIVKVSDYRSALIQGKYLAKKGIWVSEFRIESGLNCGGHAFATDGILLGPIMEEFKAKKEELSASLFDLYNPVLKSKGKAVFDAPHPIKITVQGGIGTHEEDQFLRSYYYIDSTGWGTPFLLCPEATTVDEETLGLLCKAEEKDVILSKNSPLGVRFNYLRGTTAEREKLERFRKGKAGSPCTEKFLVSNTEFTQEPICTASIKYQKHKLEQLKTLNYKEEEYEKQVNELINKECLCVGLSNAAAIKYHQPFVKNQNGVTICPGPNIAYFSKVVTLQEMTDHIYGRTNIIERNDRPHMFIKELQLYIDYLKEQISECDPADSKFAKYCNTFVNNVLQGIEYYKKLANETELTTRKTEFLDQLKEMEKELQGVSCKL